MKYEDLTSIIIGCAIKVHKYFGVGFPESIYQKSLIIELSKAGLRCKDEVECNVYYESDWVGVRRLDIIVEDIILCELKAISELDNASINQTLNYLRVFNVEVGLLFNFGEEKLRFKRFINTSKNSHIF